MRKVTGWDYRPGRFYKEFCPSCKFISCIVTHFDDDTLEFHDVYSSCQAPEHKVQWIIVRSDEPGDYISGLNQEQLFAKYIMATEGY